MGKVAVIRVEKRVIRRNAEGYRTQEWEYLHDKELLVLKITPKRVHTSLQVFDRATGDDIAPKHERWHRWYRYHLLEIKEST